VLLALEWLLCRFRLFFSSGEYALFVTADTLVRVQAFENKFGG
jgi:hypothetical protein